MPLTKQQILNTKEPATIDLILFVNSWSDKWGKAGIGYFGSNYLHRCVEIGTTVNLEATKYVFTKTLKKGMKSAEVGLLQRFLNTQGYILKVDNDFGNLTDLAVKSWQKKNGLVSDGIAGPKTLAKINSL